MIVDTEISEFLKNSKNQYQRQYDLKTQLMYLKVLANKFGLYDAADVIRNLLEK